MIIRLLLFTIGAMCASTVSAAEIAAIFGNAEYTGSVSDQIVFSELDCSRSYDIEGVCSIAMTNLNAKYSTFVNNQHLHWYKSDLMTIVPEEGMTLSGITLQCTESAYCNQLTANSGTASYDKSSATIRWRGETPAPLTLAANASQLRISYAVIEYAASESSAVEDISVEETPDSEEAVLYSLSGVRVTNPGPGLYICRRGSKVSKIYIR